MERRCANCDQLLLADESVCWQCGQPMPQQVAEPQTSSGAKEDTGRPRAALEIYAVWTALIVIAALAVTFLLGQQPRVQAANALLPDGWVVATDRQRTFIVFLPEQWEQLDAAADDEQQQLHQLFGEREAYRRATEPLTGFVQDAEPLFLARGSDAPAASAGAFLIVMRSRLLNRLTETEAMGLAQEGDVAISDARHVTDFGRSYVGLRVVVHLSDTEEMICRQQFTTGAHEALLLALCTAPGQLSPSAIDTILGSTQRLAP